MNLEELPLEARLYWSLRRIRRVEEQIAVIYPSDKIKSPVHLSIGQEAVSVGVCDVLRREDVVFGTYRGHALYLAKGGDLKRMLAELYGKATGCCRGKGGSMHLIDTAAGVMGTSAIVASTIPAAVGYAMAQRIRRRTAIVVSFFGDGATEEGVYHESLNFAAVHRLPVLFVCENNGYAIQSPLAARQPARGIHERVAAFGIPAERIDDDVLKIRDVAAAQVAAIRAGHGPRFLECATYRLREHVGPSEDFDAGYRTRAEADRWIAGDQVRAIGWSLEPALREQIERSVEQEIDEALRHADDSPPPPEEDLFVHVFAD